MVEHLGEGACAQMLSQPPQHECFMVCCNANVLCQQSMLLIVLRGLLRGYCLQHLFLCLHWSLPQTHSCMHGVAVHATCPPNAYHRRYPSNTVSASHEGNIMPTVAEQVDRSALTARQAALHQMHRWGTPGECGGHQNQVTPLKRQKQLSTLWLICMVGLRTMDTF